MAKVEKMWNEFADARKSARLERSWLEQIIEAGALELSMVKDAGGQVLTYHLNYLGKRRGQDLIVVSRYSAIPNAALRNRINRANCFGHWKTLLAFKERGLRYYDFGGWYPGTTDIQSLGMNAFKKSFGGQVVREYEGEQILTPKGWVVLTTAKILNQARGLRVGQRRETRNTADATTANCKVSPAF